MSSINAAVAMASRRMAFSGWRVLPCAVLLIVSAASQGVGAEGGLPPVPLPVPAVLQQVPDVWDADVQVPAPPAQGGTPADLPAPALGEKDPDPVEDTPEATQDPAPPEHACTQQCDVTPAEPGEQWHFRDACPAHPGMCVVPGPDLAAAVSDDGATATAADAAATDDGEDMQPDPPAEVAEQAQEQEPTAKPEDMVVLAGTLATGEATRAAADEPADAPDPPPAPAIVWLDPAAPPADVPWPLLAAAAAAGTAWLLRIILGILFSRRLLPGAVRRGDDARERILARVQAEPGIHFRALQRALQLGRGQTQHHLDVLVREGRLSLRRLQGRNCYFLAGKAGTDATALLLMHPVRRRILFALRAPAGRTPSVLKASLGIGWGSLYHHLHRLEGAGLVERRRGDGRVTLTSRGKVRQKH